MQFADTFFELQLCLEGQFLWKFPLDLLGLDLGSQGDDKKARERKPLR